MSDQQKIQRNDDMPSGIPFIIGNELAERFSFYGMKAILTVFMTEYLVNSSGALDTMGDEDAKFWYHVFVMLTYFLPIAGAIISDIFWGKYKTIMILSIVYCFGHLALALDETRTGLFIGLGLIAVGAGGIKPCVSAHVGDQFDKSRKHLIERVFSYFYIAINVGAAVSSVLTPILLAEFGPWLAFGIPGALMVLATLLFYLGRDQFIAVPAVGAKKFFGDTFSKEGIKAMGNLLMIYLFISVFWSLFDQTGSSWVLQAKSEYFIKEVTLFGREFKLLPSQIQAANPVLVIIFVPLFSFFIYPKVNKLFKLTPLRKISIGLFIAAVSFFIVTFIQEQIDAQEEVSVMWQFLAYAVLTAAEVMVSVTALEFSYTQAPNSSKSLIMSLYLLSVFFGNFIAAFVNQVIQNEDGTSMLTGPEYYWFFTLLMFATAVLFIGITYIYKGKTYIQDDVPVQKVINE